MKALKHRKRARTGLTNYYHRSKTLVNYENVIRLYFRKKSRYLVAGLYETKSVDQPDICYKTWDSRWISLDNCMLPKSKSDVFGHLVATQINKLIESKLDTTKKIILDIGPHKLIRYEPFALTVKKYLDPRLNFLYNKKEENPMSMFGKPFYCNYDLK